MKERATVTSLTSIMEAGHPDEMRLRVAVMATYAGDATVIQTITFTAHANDFMTKQVNEVLLLLQDHGVEIIDIRYPGSEDVGAVIIFAAPTGWLDDNAALIQEMAKLAAF